MKPIFVTGFPGSGLRLLEAIAHAACRHVAGPAPIDRLSPVQKFEAINEDLVADTGLHWDRVPVPAADEAGFGGRLKAGERGDIGAGVFCSPTLTLTWSFWLQANPDARLVVALRHPGEAIAALRARHPEIGEAAAVELWRAYSGLLLRAADDSRTTVVHFDSIFERTQQEISRILDVKSTLFEIDRSRRTRWMGEDAVPGDCVSAYAALCVAAGPVFAELRRGGGFEAKKRACARSVGKVEHWRAEERQIATSQLLAVDQDTLAAARRQARAAQERLQDIEQSLIFRLTKLAWSWRDRWFPPGTRRRALQRWLRLRIAGAVEHSGLLPSPETGLLEPDDREYAAHRQRTMIPAAGGPLPPLRVVTIPDGSPLSPTTADSVRAQSHPNWTWRVPAETSSGMSALASLDPRITVTPESADSSALLAAALEDLTAEDLVILAENSVQLHPHAFSMLAASIEADRADAAYCDVDHFDARGSHIRPWLKPDWSPDLVLSVDLVGPVAAVRAGQLRMLALERVPPDLWLWSLGLHFRTSGARVAHARHVLAHRPAERPFSRAGAARLITETLGREGRRGTQVAETGRLHVEWRPTPELVSIVIPTKDKAEMLAVCLQTLVGRTRYRPFEIILVDTGSVEKATVRLYDSYRGQSGFSIVHDKGRFNFSRACNAGARASRGNRLLFLNNDTEILGSEWLDRMAQWLDDPGVGAVGARLLYPDATLQHAGVVVGMGGLASHLFHQEHKGVDGIFGPEHWYRNLSAVTAACLLTSRRAFDSVGGFDETLELVYGDTDYCLRLRLAGLRIVYSPDAELVHHESQSRGKNVPRQDFIRFSEKLRALGALDGDPYFNPALSYRSTRPRIRLSALDDPKTLNRQFLLRLPAKDPIVVPDDLV